MLYALTEFLTRAKSATKYYYMILKILSFSGIRILTPLSINLGCQKGKRYEQYSI